jgi:hypothetical protein
MSPLQPAANGPPAKIAALLPPQPVIVPARSDLERLAAMLNGGSRVTILCGSECAGAHDELLKLGERLKAPMVHAMRGKEHVEWDNPYDVGMTGLIGFSSGYYAMLGCDVLLMLGTDFPFEQGRATHCCDCARPYRATGAGCWTSLRGVGVARGCRGSGVVRAGGPSGIAGGFTASAIINSNRRARRLQDQEAAERYACETASGRRE